jgi:hypothetical protein
MITKQPLPAGPALRFRDRSHRFLAAATYALALLIGLATAPVVFVAADRGFVVACLNAMFDLVGL